jgi:hypothetical protein
VIDQPDVRPTGRIGPARRSGRASPRAGVSSAIGSGHYQPPWRGFPGLQAAGSRPRARGGAGAARSTAGGSTPTAPARRSTAAHRRRPPRPGRAGRAIRPGQP